MPQPNYVHWLSVSLISWIQANAMPAETLFTKSTLSDKEQDIIRAAIASGNRFFKENDLHMTSKFKNDKKERLNKAFAILSERNIISETIKIGTRKRILIRCLNIKAN